MNKSTRIKKGLIVTLLAVFLLLEIIFAVPMRKTSAETLLPNIFEGAKVSIQLYWTNGKPSEQHEDLEPVYDTSDIEWQGIDLKATAEKYEINSDDAFQVLILIELKSAFTYTGEIIRCTEYAKSAMAGQAGLPFVYLINGNSEELGLTDNGEGLYTLQTPANNLNISAIKLIDFEFKGGSVLVPTGLRKPDEGNGSVNEGGNSGNAGNNYSGKYTSVLDDLKKDSTFNENDYKSIAKDYSLQVIQIAESSDGELFVYVYQASAETKFLPATSINISTAINDSLQYKNYKLFLLNIEGVFCKYLVEDITVKADTVRYYDISSIFRKWDKSIDSGTPKYNENLIDEAAFEVGKLYTACTLNGEVTYACTYSETILVTEKYVGLIRYPDGFGLASYKQCDSHFVAFSTDKEIDRLIEADVYYVQKSVSRNYVFGQLNQESYGAAEEKYAYLKYTDEASNPANGWFGHKYTWNRIESVSDFIENEGLNTEGLTDLKNKQWVLRFAETSYTTTSGRELSNISSTEVSEVTILRLKFETDGKVYNLGVVDNKQTGDGKPDNNNTNGTWPKIPSFSDILDDILDVLKTVFIILIAIIILVLLIWCAINIIDFIKRICSRTGRTHKHVKRNATKTSRKSGKSKK